MRGERAEACIQQCLLNFNGINGVWCSLPGSCARVTDCVAAHNRCAAVCFNYSGGGSVQRSFMLHNGSDYAGGSSAVDVWDCAGIAVIAVTF